MVAYLVHLLVEIDLADDRFADAGELDFRSRLVEAIESRGVGEVGGFGSGSGGMDISILVPEEQSGRDQVAAVVRELAPGAAFTIDVLPSEDEDTEPGAAPDRPRE
jgi:hypothetical protein